jgi:beta-glucosidase-like glycosyl hydrolase
MIMTPTVLKAALKIKTTRFGNLTSHVIARAAKRLLRPTFLLGELDGPAHVAQQHIGASAVDAPAHRALALKAAQQSVVLLQNPVEPPRTPHEHFNTRGILPLAKAGKKIVFVGPHVSSRQGTVMCWLAFLGPQQPTNLASNQPCASSRQDTVMSEVHFLAFAIQPISLATTFMPSNLTSVGLKATYD